MPVDRKLFKHPFRKGKIPQWMCPACNKGVLRGKEGTFMKEETASSKEAQKHPDWEPEWLEYTYSCRFVCTNPSCEQVVFNVGTGKLDYELEAKDDEYPEQVYFDMFYPKFFLPHLNIFQVPKETPSDIKSLISNSFSLFFTDPSSSAGSLRTALENILDHFKIKRFETRNGKRFRISLHRRIDLIPNKFSGLKDLFYAVKWLGNDGSHSKGVDEDDVMDAYDIFESILDEIFVRRSAAIKKLAKKINKSYL